MRAEYRYIRWQAVGSAYDRDLTVVSTTHIAVRKYKVCMSMRSGRQYIKRTEGSEMSEREYATAAGAANDVMRILLEDRRNRELQVEDERRQQERERLEKRESSFATSWRSYEECGKTRGKTPWRADPEEELREITGKVS